MHSFPCLQKCLNENVSHIAVAGFLKRVPVSADGDTILPKVNELAENCAAKPADCPPPPPSSSTLTLAKQLQQLGSMERSCPFENKTNYFF